MLQNITFAFLCWFYSDYLHDKKTLFKAISFCKAFNKLITRNYLNCKGKIINEKCEKNENNKESLIFLFFLFEQVLDEFRKKHNDKKECHQYQRC